MDYGMDKKKKKRSGMMYGSRAQARMGSMMMRDKKMEGSKVHSGGSQPVYGSTVADAMPVAGAN
tara:strand:- start:220 stop:411 length:192 start_codon:yes stop_codon:yes gene_type:complete